MKAWFSIIMMIIVMAASAWGQNAPANPNFRALLQQETDMLSGFLSSVLTAHFLDMDDQSQPDDSAAHGRFYRQGNRVTNGSHWIDTSIRDRFYLQEQGVVFIIPVSTLRPSEHSFSITGNLATQGGGGILITGNPAMAFSTTTGLEYTLNNDGKLQFWSGMASGTVLPDGFTEAIESLLKAVEANTRKRSPEDERLGININDIQEQIIRVRGKFSEAAANEQAFLQALNSVREPLVDALAKYGTVLHTVKPDEYVNLVFQASPASSLNTPARGTTDVISVRKSWITDYNAGSMTLDEFRKKVFQQK